MQNTANTTNTLTLYPAVIINTNDGIDRKEAEILIQEASSAYGHGFVIKNARKARNFWIMSHPNGILRGGLFAWIDINTGTLARGYWAKDKDGNEVTIDELIKKINHKDAKKIAKGIYQLRPALKINLNDGVSFKEATYLKKIYNTFEGNFDFKYGKIEDAGDKWIIKKGSENGYSFGEKIKPDRYSYRALSLPVYIDKKTGMKSTKIASESVKELMEKFKKENKQNSSWTYQVIWHFHNKYDISL